MDGVLQLKLDLATPPTRRSKQEVLCEISSCYWRVNIRPTAASSCSSCKTHIRLTEPAGQPQPALGPYPALNQSQPSLDWPDILACASFDNAVVGEKGRSSPRPINRDMIALDDNTKHFSKNI